MNREILVYLCGIHSLAFAFFHTGFWKLFRWKQDLKHLTSLNRAVVQILNLRITYLFFFLAFVCFGYPQPLYDTELGRVILIGFSLFWLGRTAEQFIFFKFDRPAGFLLTALFITGAILFTLPAL